VPVTVLPELAYLVGSRLGPPAEVALARALADGEFLVEPLESDDLGRIADLTQAYADMPLGFTDASLIAVAERLDAPAVLTTDRRHFGSVRPVHRRRFELLP
jgi:predicted nucleic acid-binding protein